MVVGIVVLVSSVSVVVVGASGVTTSTDASPAIENSKSTGLGGVQFLSLHAMDSTTPLILNALLDVNLIFCLNSAVFSKYFNFISKLESKTSSPLGSVTLPAKVKLLSGVNVKVVGIGPPSGINCE